MCVMSYVKLVGTNVKEFTDPNLLGSLEDILEKMERYSNIGEKSLKILFIN